MISKMMFALAMICSVPAIEASERTVSSYAYLDNLAVAAGTDKSSLFHNYTRVYAKYFDELRHQEIKLLEIGIYRGESVKLWESYFVKGELHFVDIDPNFSRYQSTRSQYHFVDQSNEIEMKKLVERLGGNFDIVIDDGGHRMDQQIISFQVLFPYLKSGGLYVIEDLHTSYWQEYGGHGMIGAPAVGPGTCVEFLKTLIDPLNYTAGVTACADFNKISPTLKVALNEYQSTIDSIHFYQSLCIIIKK